MFGSLISCGTFIGFGAFESLAVLVSCLGVCFRTALKSINRGCGITVDSLETGGCFLVKVITDFDVFSF